MKKFPETDDEKRAFTKISELLLDSLTRGRRDLGLKDEAKEQFVLKTVGNYIAEAKPSDRGRLMWAFWADLTTDLKPDPVAHYLTQRDPAP